MRQIANRPEVGIEFELLAQRNVNAGKTAAHRRRHRTFQAHACSLERLDQIFWDVLARFLVGLRTNRERLPFKLHPGRFQDAHRCFSDFRPDPVSGDESYSMTHRYLVLSSASVIAHSQYDEFSGSLYFDQI